VRFCGRAKEQQRTSELPSIHVDYLVDIASVLQVTAWLRLLFASCFRPWLAGGAARSAMKLHPEAPKTTYGDELKKKEPPAFCVVLVRV
jgi:hypothetical protein